VRQLSHPVLYRWTCVLLGVSVHKISHVFFITLLALTVSLVEVQAGTTGKIAGKVVDAKSKEPLIGVNVLLIGKQLGGSTEVDGNYFIINIPPGNYQLRATAIGYSASAVSNVVVSADQTTKVNFEMSEQAIEVGAVVIVAERPIVQKDLTSTTATVSSDQISRLPLETVSSVVNLQAGVVEGHFRGGRTGEVKYLVDGISVNDVFSGGQSLEPEINSVQEIQVLSGTFNAEYGEALSGVVNQVTKIASDKYTGQLSLYSGDYVTSRTGLYRNIDHVSPKDLQNVDGTISGPLPGAGSLVKFFLSGRYYYDDGYLYGKRIFKPSDSSNFSANDPSQWLIGATGTGKYVPMNNQKRISLQGKLSIDVGSSKGLILQALYEDRKYRQYDFMFQLNPDGDYTYYQKSLLGIASYNYVFGPSSFIDFNASMITSDYKQYVYENPLDPRYVNPERFTEVGGNAFYTGGTQNWHFAHKTDSYAGKIDFTSQVTSIHQIKTGAEFQQHTLHYEDFQIHVDATSGFKPALPQVGNFDYNVYTNHPYQYAAYAQDKIELDYLIVNVGVRFDYFQPDGRVLKNPDNIAELDPFQPPFPDSLSNPASAKYQISPRVGISYPITDRGAIHFSYGHFFQVPPFEFLYRNPNFRIPLTGTFPAAIGNVIGNADLQPQQTTMYEVGLQQELTPFLGLTVTTYYKDIRNLLGMQLHIKNDFKVFGQYINRDYGAVKGFTISLDKRFGDGYGATLDYTYQTAYGNASNPNDDFNKQQASPPIEINKELVPLDWDRRHSLNLTLTGGILDDFIGSFIARLGSGLPYTPSFQNQRTGLENSDNRPMFFTADFYLTKYLQLYGYQCSLFLKVYNVFDTPGEIDIFSDTGRAGYTLELTRAQQAPRGANTVQDFFMRPDFYLAPRQIVVGTTLSF
jgi:outer membrane receptor protein involved in Fe transport